MLNVTEQDLGDADQIVRASQLQPLNPGQQRARVVLMGDQTHTCLAGGSRSGKTALIIRTLITRALRAPGSRHLMVRFRANALRASVVLDTLPKVMRMWFPGITITPHRMDGFFELPNGSQLWTGGLDDADRVEKILGQEYASIYAGETSQISYHSIMVLRTRLAQVCECDDGTRLKLRGYYDLNPTSTQHWTHLEFVQKRSPVDKTLLADPENYEISFVNPEDNRANLDPTYLTALAKMPKLYRERFYAGKYIVAIDGALWTPDIIELCRVDKIDPDPAGRKLADFQRIVVAVDPSGAQSKFDIKSDEIGIVAVGKRHSNVATVLEDATLRGSPKDWAKRAVATYKRWHADAIVAESNYGGEMVRSTIQTVDPNVPVILVTASRGKVVRAEPVSALCEGGKLEFAGQFPEMEEQLSLFNRQGYQGDRSPDRGDSMIWGVTSLMLGELSTYTLANVS